MRLSPAKTAEPIEIPYVIWTLVGSRNHLLDVGRDPQTWRGNFEGVKALAQDMTKHDADGRHRLLKATQQGVEPVRYGLGY